MSIAATATQNLTIDELVTVAYQLVGFSNPKAADLLLGRRVLFLCLQAMANDGIFLNVRERAALALVPNQNYVDAAADTVSIEAGGMLRTSDSRDIPIELWSPDEYHTLPVKTTPGQPTAYFPELLPTNWRVFVYPVPDSSDYASLQLWRQRRFRDTDDGSAHVDVRPKAYLAITNFLSAKLARAKGRRDLATEVMQEWKEERDRTEDDESDKGGSYFEIGETPWGR